MWCGDGWELWASRCRSRVLARVASPHPVHVTSRLDQAKRNREYGRGKAGEKTDVLRDAQPTRTKRVVCVMNGAPQAPTRILSFSVLSSKSSSNSFWG